LRDALTDNNSHEPSITLLESIMASDDGLRSDAAEVLEPIYLARMQWPKLTAALEARIQNEQDVEERKRLLTRLGQICEDQLEDFDAAIDVYARLLREDPRDEDTWETLTRLAKVGSQWNRLGKILGRAFDEQPAVDEATARLAKYTARIYSDRGGNHARASQPPPKAPEFGPRGPEAVRALEAARSQ